MSANILQFPSPRERAERSIDDVIRNAGLTAPFRELIVTRLAARISRIGRTQYFALSVPFPPELASLTEDQRQSIGLAIADQLRDQFANLYHRELVMSVYAECVAIWEMRAAGIEVMIPE